MRKSCPADNSDYTRKILRRPGIEPGSTAWKAAMLTIIPPTLYGCSGDVSCVILIVIVIVEFRVRVFSCVIVRGRVL